MKVLNLPEEVRTLLVKRNDLRNSLHFKVANGAAYSHQTVKDISTLINFVNGTIKGKRDFLEDSLGV